MLRRYIYIAIYAGLLLTLTEAPAFATAPGVPACTAHHITNNGGPVIHNPVINLVYWGPPWGQTYPYDDYWEFGLASFPAFYTRLREYGVGPGGFGQSYAYSAGQQGQLTASNINSGLLAALGTHVPTANDVYVIFLPSGTTSQVTASPYHTAFQSGGHNYYYAIIPWLISGSNSMQNSMNSATHELMEIFTDPNAGAITNTPWTYCDSAAGCATTEIADVCEFLNGPPLSPPSSPCNGAILPYTNPACIGRYQAAKVWSQQACRCVSERDLNQVDVNATGVPDPTVFRPSQVTWYGDNAANNWVWGQSTDIPFAGDFNGDGRTEYALFRPNSSQMFILNIQTGQGSSPYPIGQAGDIPVVGDYDGDSLSDLAVWQASAGWRVTASSTGLPLTVGSAASCNGSTCVPSTGAAVNWGIAGDIPVPADYDGDGMTDMAIARPSEGLFYVLPSSAPYKAYTYRIAPQGPCTGFTYGDIPVPGDYNGDGVADFAYWQPSNGAWCVQYNVTNVGYTVLWGASGDIPVARDYDGDWAADPGIWRPSDGTWRLLSTVNYTNSTWHTPSSWIQWGLSGDLPIERPAGML